VTSAPPVAGRHITPIERLAIVLWVRLPRAVIRRFPGAWGIAGDGHTLVAFPPLAVVAPLVVTGAGLLVGAQQLGYEQVYTESVLLLAIAIALGTFSTQLGLLAVTAFAVGELLVGRHHELRTFGRFIPRTPPDGPLETLVRLWLPMVISYLILAVAVVVIPRTGRALLVTVGRWRRIPAAIAWPVASGLFVVVVWIALRTWVAAAPTLIRPRFTWLGGQPTVEAISSLQEQGDELVAAGVLAAIARQVLLGAALWWEPMRDRVRDAEANPVPRRRRRARHTNAPASLADDPSDPASPGGDETVALPGTGRRMVSDLMAATLATLVLAGVLERAWLWVVTFSLFLTLRLVRSGVVAPDAVDRWKRLVAKVPAVARLVALWVVARVVTDAMVRGFIGSYTGMAVVVLVGAAVVFAVFPGTPRHPEPGAGERSPSSGPAPAGPPPDDDGPESGQALGARTGDGTPDETNGAHP
jgi:hypothetical protein